MSDPRQKEYEARYHCQLLDPLGMGQGQDGIVMRSAEVTAVKFFDSLDRYDRELQVYRALQARGINLIADHNVPELIRADDQLRVIEMTIVHRPFLLDFAGAKFDDEVPDFEPHVMNEHYEHLQELFGDRWTDALHVAEMFRIATGFTLMDIHPGNIAFDD